MTCSQIERLESVGKGLQDLRHGLNELRRSQQDQLNLFNQMLDCIAADQDSSAEEEEVQVPVKSHKTVAALSLNPISSLKLKSMAAKRSGSASEDEYPVKSPRSASDAENYRSGCQVSGSKNLVIFCNSMKNHVLGFQVYVTNLNLNSMGSSNSPETLVPRIEGDGYETSDGMKMGWAGCVLNSTLYIIREWVTDSCYVLNEDDCKVMKFDLSLLNDKKIGIEEFKAAAYMKHPKHMPIAVPTPDGKRILVFQAQISNPKTCFELYDPLEDAWTELEPSDFPGCLKSAYVQSYYFIDNSRFVLQTMYGYFVLHLNSEKKMDPLPDLPLLGGSIPCMNKVTVGDRVITAGAVHVMRSETDDDDDIDIVHPFELSFSQESFGLYGSLPFIALLEHKVGDENAYSLVSHTRACVNPELNVNDQRRNIVSIDVCRTNLVSLNTTVEGTLKYRLDPGYWEVIITLTMFVI